VNADELDAVALRALSWLHGHLDDFRLPEDPAAPAVDRNTTLKPIGELAQLSLAIMRGSSPGDRRYQLAEQLMDFAWRETSRGDLFLVLAHGEPHATYPMEIYASFAEAGLRHPGFEEYSRFITTTRAWRGTELDPTRVLAVLNAQHRLGIPLHQDPAEAAMRTWLGGLAEPWAFEVRAGYALTHYVFHVTNWGGSPEALPVWTRDYLTLWLPAWLDSCVESEHWDLTGELLAVASTLPPAGAGSPHDLETEARAWRVLAEEQESSGALRETGHRGGQDAEPGFLFRYHSTLVLAFASVLAAARARSAEPVSPSPRAGAARGSDGTPAPVASAAVSRGPVSRGGHP
jgi:hypothetical protein